MTKREKALLCVCIIVFVLLAAKAFKQFLYLTFTLLTLKAVWILLLALYLLFSIKKWTQPSNDPKK